MANAIDLGRCQPRGKSRNERQNRTQKSGAHTCRLSHFGIMCILFEALLSTQNGIYTNIDGCCFFVYLLAFALLLAFSIPFPLPVSF